MRQEVHDLAVLGSLPSEDAEEEVLETHGRLLHAIAPPVTNEEARVLVGLFGPDDCHGLAWSLLHLIETAPGWPLTDCLQPIGNEWIDRLRRRVENAGLFPS